MYYCVTYDISSARLRRRAVLWCKEAGLVRLQRSVFAGRSSAPHIRELQDKITAELPSTDRFCVIPLDAAAWRQLWQGGDVQPVDALARERPWVAF